MKQIVWQALAQIFFDPRFYFAVGAVLLLERLIPAKPSQKILSRGLVQDTAWLCLQTFWRVTLVAGYVALLQSFYREHLSFLTIHRMLDLRRPVRYLIWFLVTDLLEYFHHWLRHKVPWFWHFHEVHHSQRELNLFTDLRYHPVEYLISKTVTVFPLLILSSELYDIVFIAIANQWFTRLIHANLRTDFGPLRYVLVTPQSHRIHHSIEPRHYDQNYGVTLSVWDRIFGTQYNKYDEYPDTGIPDKEFPVEQNTGLWGILWTPVRQHMYPFQAILRRKKAESDA